MNTEVYIRPCKPEEYEEVASIYTYYTQYGNVTMDENVYTGEAIAKWVEKFNDRENLYVVKRGEKTLGWGIIKRYSDRKGYRFACEYAVYLRPEEVRKGYGSMMKRHLIAESKLMGYHHALVKVWASNAASIGHNLAVGFEVVGRQKEIGFKNGQWLDVIIMQFIIQ